VRFTATDSTVSPVDSTVLELTVYNLGGGSKGDYVLNRGNRNPSVAVRAPAGNELTYVAPPPPPVVAPDTRPEPVTRREPVSRKEPVRQPRSPAAPRKPAVASSIGLTKSEEGWLTLADRKTYDSAAKAILAAAKPDNDKYLQLARDARTKVRLNLRDDATRTGYDAAVASSDAKTIDAFIAKTPHYSGAEIALSPDERAKLNTIDVSGSANAGTAYDAAIKTAMTGAANPDDVHVELHQIVALYRGKIQAAAAPPPPPKDATTAPTFATITTAAALADLAKNNPDAARALCQTANPNPAPVQEVADACAALMKTPAGPSAPVTPLDDGTSVKTLAQFNLLSDAEKDNYFGNLDKARKQKLCSMLGAAQGDSRGDACGDALMGNNAADVMKQCKAKISLPTGPDKDGAKATAYQQALTACEQKAGGSCQPGTTASNAGTADPNARFKTACKGILAINSPSTGPASLGATTVPGPDKCDPKTDKSCQGDAPKPDTNFWTNVSNGMGFGLAALLLASFFGGPALMLGVALAAGVGGYFFSKSINNPPPAPPKS
jgi:hypothetical protein